MSDWQPIGTAPKEGDLILVWIGGGYGFALAFWDEGGWWSPDANADVTESITHWMPLPDPPK